MTPRRSLALALLPERRIISLIALAVTASSAVAAADSGPPAPAAPAAPSTQVEVSLDAARGRVQGQVAFRFDNATATPLTRVYLWLLPNRMARPPAALDDVNHYWIYPRRFNAGAMDITAVRAGPPGGEAALEASAWRAEPHAVAGRGVLWSVTLARAVDPGQSVRLIVDFAARIPERYGPLGCIDGQCTLLGGFYPMLAALDSAGWDLEGPPMRTDMTVTVELVEPAAVVLLGQVFGQDGPAGPGRPHRPHRRAERVTRAHASASRVPYAPLIVAPRLYESTRTAGRVRLRYLSPQPAPPADDARGQIVPYTQENYHRHALASAVEALELLDAIKWPATAQTLTLVEAPLRFELASAHPGAQGAVIVVSDRFYRIWPAERFRKFHQRQLVDAVYHAIVGRRVARRGAERDRDIDMAADVMAAYLTDLFVVRQYKKSEFMGDILQPVAFIPVVDQLLYATQTMFAGAFFGGVLDDEPLRDDARRFMHQRPRGKLFYEKLRDLLTPEGLRAAMRAMIRDGQDVRGAAEAAYGASLDWFFRQWSRPYPRLDYRLAGTSSRRLGEGAGYEHAIAVERRTAEVDRPPVEPVVVEVVLEDGERLRLRWDGRGQRGVLRFRADTRVARVVVDPERRLVEQSLPGESAHPRFDNRDVHRVRFVYNSFGVLLNITDLSALLAADFSLGRVHDVHHRTRFSIFTSASVQFGLTARYSRGFGPLVSPDNLLSSASLRLSAQRLRSGFFGGDDERAASRLSLGLGLSSSDRVFVFEPRFSRDVGVGASLSVTRRDAGMGADGGDVDADVLISGALAANVSRTHTFGDTHTLGLELDGSVVFGDIATRSQLVSAGGAEALRGYAPAALFGRARVMARAEYRHVFVHDVNYNLGHYNWARGFGGALFVDAAALSSCDGYDVMSADNVYASAGYGLRMFYDSFGTLPQLMRVDVAVRLVDRNRDCLGAPLGASPPVMVYVSFLPPF